MTSSPIEHASWIAAGSNAAAQATYASIKRALATVIAQRDVDVFLQGSYANATNIRADSDVDIVVMTKQTFQGARDRLSQRRQAELDAYPAATYTSPNLRNDVIQALTAYYGAARVNPRNKCITVAKRDSYVDADVVPCLQYRRFRNPESPMHDFVEGLSIIPRDGGRIIDFPKEHISNGQIKNGSCLDRYKPTVRQMKRLRNRAVAEGRLRDGTAPGYLLECMTFNVPNDQFVSNHSTRLRDVVTWLKIADKTNFWSCDGVHHLFRDEPGGFSVATAQQIIDALWEAY